MVTNVSEKDKALQEVIDFLEKEWDAANNASDNMYIIKKASYAINAIAMLAIIIIQITNNANPISIAILSFLYGAYVTIVFVILYEEHLEKEYE